MSAFILHRAAVTVLLCGFLLAQDATGGQPADANGIQTVTSGCFIFFPNDFGFHEHRQLQPGEIVRYVFLPPSGLRHPALLWLPGAQTPRRVQDLVIDPTCTIVPPAGPG